MIPKSRIYAVAALVVPSLFACGPGEPDHEVSQSGTAATTPAAVSPSRTGDAPAVVFLGTSLTAGYGVGEQSAYPAVIQSLIDSAGLEFEVVNAGVSGETSAGALARIDWVLQRPAAVLVIETGANDGLRGLPAGELRANLQGIIDAARSVDNPPAVLIAAMEAPPNLGRRYIEEFRQVYRDVARENGLRLVPFFLDGVAGVDSLNQPDGIHPTPSGHRRLAHNMWQELQPVLAQLQG